MRERESVSSSLSLCFFFPFLFLFPHPHFSSASSPGRRPPASSPCPARRRRRTGFVFFSGGLKERESVVGRGREAATLPFCSLIPSISRFTIIFLFSFPIECRTWLSPEPSPRSTTTRLFCRGVWICKKKGASERQKGKRLRFVLKEA